MDAHDRRKLDLMMPAGLGSMILGGALVLAGGITAGAARADEYCGVTGCVARPAALENNIAANLIGAGSGFALVGAAGFLSWAANRPTGEEFRKSEPMMVVGLGATALAAASLGMGIGNTLTYNRENTDLSTAWPFFLATGVLSGVGIPLLAVGAKKQTPDDLVPKPADRSKRKSSGMVIAGSVLTGIGGLAFTAGTVFLGLDLAFGGPGYMVILWGPLHAGSAIFSSIGIPLIVVGNQRPKANAATDVDAAPEIDLAGAGLRATWRLP